jgi:hypothetical protein
MIHINIGGWTREIFRGFKANKIIFLIYLVIIPILIFLNLIRRISMIQQYGVEHSLADCFVFVTDKFFFSLLIIPLSVYFLLHLLKNDLKLNFIIRQTSKKSIWIKQMYKTFLLSFFLTTYLFICTFIIGGLFSKSYINWNYNNSVYYLANKTTNEYVTMKNVIIMFIIICTLINMLINILFQIIYWLTNSTIIGWIIIFFIGSWDIFQSRFSILYGKLSINHIYWRNPFEIKISIIYATGFFLGLLIIGLKVAKRKDFLNEND